MLECRQNPPPPPRLSLNEMKSLSAMEKVGPRAPQKGGTGSANSAGKLAKIRIEKVNRNLTKDKSKCVRKLSDRDLFYHYRYAFVLSLFVLMLPGSSAVRALDGAGAATVFTFVAATGILSTFFVVISLGFIGFTTITMATIVLRCPQLFLTLVTAWLFLHGFVYGSLVHLFVSCYCAICLHRGHTVHTLIIGIGKYLCTLVDVVCNRVRHHANHFWITTAYGMALCFTFLARLSLLLSVVRLCITCYTLTSEHVIVGLLISLWIVVLGEVFISFVLDLAYGAFGLRAPDVTFGAFLRCMASYGFTVFVVPVLGIVCCAFAGLEAPLVFVEQSSFVTGLGFTSTWYNLAKSSVDLIGSLCRPSTSPARLTTFGIITGLGGGCLYELLLEELAVLAITWANTTNKVVLAMAVRNFMMSALRGVSDSSTIDRVRDWHEEVRHQMGGHASSVVNLFKQVPGIVSKAFAGPEGPDATCSYDDDDKFAGLNDPNVTDKPKFKFQSDDGSGPEAGFLPRIAGLNKHRNAKDFIVTAGLVVCLMGYIDSGGKEPLALSASIKAVKDWATSATDFTDVLSSVHTVSSLAYRCFSVGSFEPLFDSTSKFSKWRAEVKDFASDVASYATRTDIKSQQLINRGAILMSTSSELRVDAQQVGGSYYTAYTDTARLLATTQSTIQSMCANAAVRQEPLGVIIYGKPGIGKTEVTQALHKAHCAVLGIKSGPGTEGTCFTYTGDTKYMDGLTSNAITFVLDDVGKNNNKAVPMDPAIDIIIGVINSTPYVPNMASVEDKGNIVFKPNLVIATTNVRDLNARPYVGTPDAVWRRFPIVVEPVVKPRYRKAGKHGLDRSKTTMPEEGFPDWWSFKVSEVITRGNGDPIYRELHNFQTTRELTAFVMAELRKKMTTFQEMQRMQANWNCVVDSLCNYCFKPQHECDMFSGGRSGGCVCPGHVERRASPDLSAPVDLQAGGGDPEQHGWVVMFNVILSPLAYAIYVITSAINFAGVIVSGILAVATFAAGLWQLTEIIAGYVSWFRGDDEVDTNLNILSWTIKGDDVKAKRTREAWQMLASTLVGAALLYGLSYYMSHAGTYVEKVARDVADATASAAYHEVRDFVKPKLEEQARWPDTGLKPSRWNSTAFEPTSGTTVYSNTSTAEVVRDVVGKHLCYLSLYSAADCRPDSFVTGTHGMFLDNTTIATVSHFFHPMGEDGNRADLLSSYPELWVRVYLAGGATAVVRKFCRESLYKSPSCPEICAFRFEGQLPGILVRDDDAQRNPFVTRGFRTYSKCCVDFAGAFMDTKVGRTLPHAQCGNVLSFEDAGIPGSVSGKIALTTMTRFEKGTCGSPIIVRTGPDESPRGAILGMHVGMLGNSHSVVAVLDNESAMDIVKGVRNRYGDFTGGFTAHSLTANFEPEGIHLSKDHTLGAPGEHSPFSKKWLEKEAAEDIDGLRIQTYGTIRDRDGAPHTSGAGGKTPVRSTPFRDIAERLGHFCSKAGAVFTHTHKTLHLLKIDNGLHSPPEYMVDIVARCVLAHWQDALEKEFASSMGEFFGTYPLSYHEAINGIPGCDRLNRIPMDTSAGYPWNRRKDTIFSQSEDGSYAMPEEVQERIEHMEKSYDRGHLAGPIFTATFKHEPVSEAKIAAKKARVIYGGPVDYSLMVRRLFGTFMVHVQAYPHVYSSYMGTNPESDEWTRLIERLLEFINMFAGDYSGFDTSAFSSKVMHATWHIIISMNLWLNQEHFRPNGCPAFSERDINHMWGLAGDTSSPLVNFFGDLLRYEALNPSGHPLTTIFNGAGNVVLICCAYVQHRHRATPGGGTDPTPQEVEAYARDFFRLVRLAVYGDDHIVSTKDESFNFSAFKAALKEFGIKVTAADTSKSDSDYTFQALDEIDFLKRAFIFDPEIDLYRAPLRKEVIDKMFCVWVVKPSEDHEQHVASVLRAISLAASQHDREYFDLVHRHIATIMEEKGYSPALFGRKGLPSYDAYTDSAYRGGSIDFEAFNADTGEGYFLTEPLDLFDNMEE